MDEQESRHTAMRMLGDLCHQRSIRLFVIEGDPVSKARPRFSKGGRPYTPTKTIEGEKRIARLLEGSPPFRSNVAVSCLFFRASRQRVDVDNLLKAVLDAGTRANLWEDDSQVTALVGVIEYDPDRPRTIACFGEHQSSLTRGDAARVACEACGTLFFPSGRRREHARWCSAECRARLVVPVDCPSCGQPFRRRSGNQTYCSSLCRGAAQATRAKADRQARTHCRRGHALDGENSYILSNGRKRCRTCQAEQAIAYRERRRAARPLFNGPDDAASNREDA